MIFEELLRMKDGAIHRTKDEAIPQLFMKLGVVAYDPDIDMNVGLRQ